MPFFLLNSGARLIALVVSLLLAPHAGAVRFSICQGNFEAIRGPAYNFSTVAVPATFAESQLRGIEAGAYSIYQHWQELLAAPVPFVVDVRLELLGDPGSLARRKQELAPELPEVTGFYAWRERLAVALVAPGSAVETQRRALHEISHLITVSQLGGAPHWLAEGLAEVHETVEPAPDGPSFGIHARHRQWLSNARDPSLAELFSASHEAWNGAEAHRLYAMSWSLVYFLLQTPEGRGALGFTLQHAATHSCGSYDASKFLARAYPGGASSLQRDWAAWLGSV